MPDTKQTAAIGPTMTMYKGHPTDANQELAVHESGRGRVVVEVRGELTRDGRLERLRQAVERWFHEQRIHEIHVDLSGATAIDLQGLGTLLALRRQSGREGASFVVDNPRGAVRSRLEQTGTLDYLRGIGMGHAQ
jgi:anti-anti-sigma factor